MLITSKQKGLWHVSWPSASVPAFLVSRLLVPKEGGGGIVVPGPAVGPGEALQWPAELESTGPSLQPGPATGLPVQRTLQYFLSHGEHSSVFYTCFGTPQPISL